MGPAQVWLLDVSALPAAATPVGLRATAGRLVCAVIAAALDCAVADVRTGHTCRRCGSAEHGSLRVLAPADGLRASLSHTPGLVAVAVGAVAVGVDVEAVRGDADWSALAHYVVADGEPRPLPGDLAGWFDLWTRKESALKMTGEGLLRPMPTMRLGEPRGGWSAVTLADDPDGPAPPVGMVSPLDCGPAHRGAVTVAGARPEGSAVVHRPDPVELLADLPVDPGHRAELLAGLR